MIVVIIVSITAYLNIPFTMLQLLHLTLKYVILDVRGGGSTLKVISQSFENMIF